MQYIEEVTGKGYLFALYRKETGKSAEEYDNETGKWSTTAAALDAFAYDGEPSDNLLGSVHPISEAEAMKHVERFEKYHKSGNREDLKL